jgi:hypothetical protein
MNLQTQASLTQGCLQCSHLLLMGVKKGFGVFPVLNGHLFESLQLILLGLTGLITRFAFGGNFHSGPASRGFEARPELGDFRSVFMGMARRTEVSDNSGLFSKPPLARFKLDVQLGAIRFQLLQLSASLRGKAREAELLRRSVTQLRLSRPQGPAKVIDLKSAFLLYVGDTPVHVCVGRQWYLLAHLLPHSGNRAAVGPFRLQQGTAL